jgi:hypothetical protein
MHIFSRTPRMGRRQSVRHDRNHTCMSNQSTAVCVTGRYQPPICSPALLGSCASGWGWGARLHHCDGGTRLTLELRNQATETRLQLRCTSPLRLHTRPQRAACLPLDCQLRNAMVYYQDTAVVPDRRRGVWRADGVLRLVVGGQVKVG